MISQWRNRVIRELSPDQFEAELLPGTLLLDVRTEEEYRHGHLEGARLIPVQELSLSLSKIKLFKDSPVLIYCRSGIRSITAGEILLNAGFTSVGHLTLGITGWIMAEKKVVL